MSRERVEFDVIGRDQGGSKAFRAVGDAAAKAADQVDDLGKTADTTSEQVKGLGDSTKGAGDDADQAAPQWRGLADEIEATQARMRSLADEIDRTGNLDLTKDLRRQQTELRKLMRVQDLLPDVGIVEAAGELTARTFGAAFVDTVGPVLAKAPMGAPGAAIGAALGVALVPALGAAVSGAVLGGVGVGGVIGGVALASRDSRVQAAGKALGETITGDLESSATRFVEPTVRGVGIIRSAWSDVSDDVDDTFAATSRYVEPLARGVAGMVKQIAPGFREAAEAAGPVIRELSDGLPRIGDAIGDVLSDISGDADEGASAIRGMVIAGESGIRTFGALASGLADVYRTVLTVSEGSGQIAEKWVGWVPILGDSVRGSNDKLAELRAALEAGGEAGDEAGRKIGNGLDKVEEGAAGATAEVETFADSLRRLNGDVIGVEEANIRLEEAIDSATDAAKRNGDGIDANNPKQRANRQALMGIATAANEAAARIFETTGSQELASRASERGRAAFLKTAEAMGVEAGKAKALANQLFGIPNIERTVKANTDPARSQVNAYKSWLESVNLDKTSTVRQRIIKEQYTARGGNREFSQGGYVDGPGPRGIDSVPAMLAPGEGVLTAREVDQLGGPAGFAQLRASLRGERPAAGTGGTATARPTAGGSPMVDDLYRALVRALQALPIVRVDAGRAADIFLRTG